MNDFIIEYRAKTYTKNIYLTTMLDVDAYLFGYTKLTSDIISLMKRNSHVIKGCYTKYLPKIKQDIRDYCNKYDVSFHSL